MAAINTIQVYNLDGVSKDFPVPFEYLARKFVQVTLLGTTRTPLTLVTEFVFTNATTIRTLTAWGPTNGYTQIEVRRLTSATDRIVDFNDATILRAGDLNTSELQSMHIAEEARNSIADVLGLDGDGNLDARFRRIVNVTAPVNNGDALNLLFYKTESAGLYVYRDEARQARNEALQFQEQALASSLAAASSAANAEAVTAGLVSRVATLEGVARTFAYWGAKGDGIADDTLRIRGALASGLKYFSTDRQAIYRITERITVPSGVTIDNTSGATFLWDGPTTSADIDGPFYTSGLKVRFTKPIFINQSLNDNVAGILAVASQGLRVIEPVAIDCTVLRTQAPVGVAYDGVITSGPGMNVCYDTVITSPETKGRANNKHAASVDLYYAKSWAVLGGRSVDVKFGVQFWGGNAAIIGGNGVEANERKASQGLVVGFHAVNGMAGVWGSMGSGIEVVGCYVDTMYDVGIDFEGCVDCGAVGNNVRDCINGNFATFYFNRNVSFRGNTSYQGTARPHYRSYNSTQTTSNRNVTFSGNNCRSPTGVISTIDLGGGSIESFDASFNTLHNVRVVVTANNLKFINIIGNTMSFDTAILTGILESAIFAGPVYGNGSATVSGNRVRSSVAQPAGAVGIGAYGVDPNTSGVYDLWDNTINGFPVDIATQHAGANAGQRSYFNLHRNRMGASVYQRTETGALASKVTLRDNTSASGADFPAVIPTTGQWDAGTRIRLATPITGGYWEAICTVGGTPGTWKGIGAVAA